MSIRLLFILTFFTHVSFAGGRVILPLSAIHYQASPFIVGVVMSLLSVVAMVFAVSWGRYVDRVGVRGPMLIGAGAVLAAMVFGWAVPRLEALFPVSLVMGSGFVLYHIAAMQAAGAIGPPEDRVRNFTLLALAFSSGVIVGPTVAGLLIDEIGHRGAFLALAAGALVTMAVLALKKIKIPGHGPAARQGEKRRLADLLRHPGLKPVFIASVALSTAWDLFSFVMPIHGTRIGLSASAIGFILGTFGGAVFAVRLILPLVMRRLDEWQVLIGAMFLTGAALFVFPLVNGVPLLVALAFLLGVGLGSTQPMIMALLYNKAPAGRGAEVVGVRTVLLNFSQTSVPLAFGALGSALGMAPVFWAMGIALCWAGYLAVRSK
ncbi:MAG: MFS transporter [Betaproteobacteria bacterium]|nr:MFS transporter [Betaproteobacteria bacterium]